MVIFDFWLLRQFLSGTDRSIRAHAECKYQILKQNTIKVDLKLSI